MKYIFELVLTTVIVFFIWNFLKRMFFIKVFRGPKTPRQPDVSQQRTKDRLDSKLNWDAETVEYEEIKEPKQ